MPRIPRDRPNPGKEIKHKMFEKNHFKLCNRLIDKLNKGYDENERDTLSRQLVHDPSFLFEDSTEINPTKHKRSMTNTIGVTLLDKNMNNDSSVNIHISEN